MVTHILIKIFRAKTRSIADNQNLIDVFDAFILSVTVVIVTVPEGLPIIVSMSNVFLVGPMSEKSNHLRELHATEIIGNI